MSSLRRCLPGIVTILGLVGTPAIACGQEHRHDAEAYPCAEYPKLGIRADEQGFSIARLDPATLKQTNPVFRTPPEIAIGAALRIDRSIFTSRVMHQAGGKDAHR